MAPSTLQKIINGPGKISNWNGFWSPFNFSHGPLFPLWERPVKTIWNVIHETVQEYFKIIFGHVEISHKNKPAESSSKIPVTGGPISNFQVLQSHRLWMEISRGQEKIFVNPLYSECMGGHIPENIHSRSVIQHCSGLVFCYFLVLYCNKYWR